MFLLFTCRRYNPSFTITLEWIKQFVPMQLFQCERCFDDFVTVGYFVGMLALLRNMSGSIALVTQTTITV